MTEETAQETTQETAQETTQETAQEMTEEVTRSMTQEEIVEFVAGLPGVHVQTAGPGDGSPEVAWGDTFFFHEPGQRMPFATIVIKDYPGFDTESNLDRPGVFRVNVGTGRQRYEELFGHPPAAHAEHRAEYDFTEADRLMPHPVYAVQGWTCVVNPGERTAATLRSLITDARSRVVGRDRRA